MKTPWRDIYTLSHPHIPSNRSEFCITYFCGARDQNIRIRIQHKKNEKKRKTKCENRRASPIKYALPENNEWKIFWMFLWISTRIQQQTGERRRRKEKNATAKAKHNYNPIQPN